MSGAGRCKFRPPDRGDAAHPAAARQRRGLVAPADAPPLRLPLVSKSPPWPNTRHSRTELALRRICTLLWPADCPANNYVQNRATGAVGPYYLAA